jgi:hypothetical protein
LVRCCCCASSAARFHSAAAAPPPLPDREQLCVPYGPHTNHHYLEKYGFSVAPLWHLPLTGAPDGGGDSGGPCLDAEAGDNEDAHITRPIAGPYQPHTEPSDGCHEETFQLHLSLDAGDPLLARRRALAAAAVRAGAIGGKAGLQRDFGGPRFSFVDNGRGCPAAKAAIADGECEAGALLPPQAPDSYTLDVSNRWD